MFKNPPKNIPFRAFSTNLKRSWKTVKALMVLFWRLSFCYSLTLKGASLRGQLGLHFLHRKHSLSLRCHRFLAVARPMRRMSKSGNVSSFASTLASAEAALRGKTANRRPQQRKLGCGTSTSEGQSEDWPKTVSKIGWIRLFGLPTRRNDTTRSFYALSRWRAGRKSKEC